VLHRQHDQLLRVLHRQRAQQQRVHHAKNRRVRANAERQRQHRHDGKRRAFRQHPQAEPDILKEGFHPPPRARIPSHL